jgi:hypothetical protein
MYSSQKTFCDNEIKEDWDDETRSTHLKIENSYQKISYNIWSGDTFSETLA